MEKRTPSMTNASETARGTLLRHARHARAPFDFPDGFRGRVRHDEPMERHTSYRIGGPARWFVSVESLDALSLALRECDRAEIPWTIVGQGSNLLVADTGYDGAVIVLSGEFKQWSFDKDTTTFTVGAAVSLARIVQEAYRQGLSGLEFAVGIPGSIGGAVRMNAGNRSEWMSSRILWLTTFSLASGLKRYHVDDLEWGYRQSTLPSDEIVLECGIVGVCGQGRRIREAMEAALRRRKDAQPLGVPSCGSVFCNPPGESAGALIARCGLAGACVGGAQISPLHANFIVNTGGACSSDVAALMKMARDEVMSAYGIELQPEVRFLGFA